MYLYNVWNRRRNFNDRFSLVIKRNTNRCRYTYFFSICTRIETCNLVFDTYIKLPTQQGKYIFEGVFFFLLSEMGVNRLDWATVVKKKKRYHPRTLGDVKWNFYNGFWTFFLPNRLSGSEKTTVELERSIQNIVSINLNFSLGNVYNKYTVNSPYALPTELATNIERPLHGREKLRLWIYVVCRT